MDDCQSLGHEYGLNDSIHESLIRNEVGRLLGDAASKHSWNVLYDRKIGLPNTTFHEVTLRIGATSTLVRAETIDSHKPPYAELLAKVKLLLAAKGVI